MHIYSGTYECRFSHICISYLLTLTLKRHTLKSGTHVQYNHKMLCASRASQILLFEEVCPHTGPQKYIHARIIYTHTSMTCTRQGWWCCFARKLWSSAAFRESTADQRKSCPEMHHPPCVYVSICVIYIYIHTYRTRLWPSAVCMTTNIHAWILVYAQTYESRHAYPGTEACPFCPSAGLSVVLPLAFFFFVFDDALFAPGTCVYVYVCMYVYIFMHVFSMHMCVYVHSCLICYLLARDAHVRALECWKIWRTGKEGRIKNERKEYCGMKYLVCTQRVV